MTEEAETAKNVLRLLRRTVKQSHPKKDPTPLARYANPNREFAGHDNDRPAVWFFVALPIFMILYSIWMRIGAG